MFLLYSLVVNMRLNTQNKRIHDVYPIVLNKIDDLRSKQMTKDNKNSIYNIEYTPFRVGGTHPLLP